MTDAIASDLEAQTVKLAELHIDRAYLSSSFVKQRPNIGSRKNLFDLRRTAVVHNLHVIAKFVAQSQDHQASSLTPSAASAQLTTA